MVATPLANPYEYTALKNLVVYLVPTILDITSPTRAELDAGVDVTKHIPKTGITGFTKTAAVVQSDNLKTGGSIPLDDGFSIDAASIQFKMSRTGMTTDIRSVLDEGDFNNVVLFDAGDTAGLTCDVWPVLVQTMSKTRQAGAPMMITASFQCQFPAENVTVPS